MLTIQSFTAALAFLALGVQASPLSRRDVIAPKITSPTKDSVWPVGSTQTVTWDTSNFPPVSQITNILGKVILGFDVNDSLNLDFNHPLAQNFNLTDGSVNVTVPSVTPRDDYLIVLFGDSGNTSPAFSITKISAPGSPSGSASSAAVASVSQSLITTPIPITGSVITGGVSSSADVSASTTPSATDASSAPLTTATTPSTILSSASDSASAIAASASTTTTTTTSAAWSLHEPITMSFKALSVCIAATLALVMV